MKRLAKLCTLVMVLVMILGLFTTGYAAGTVKYNGNSNKFIFAPGTTESPTSLFGNFQNVMPGDTLTEKVVIKNDSSKGIKIKVYIRSLGAQEDTEDFLSQMDLTVKQKNTSVLFSAPADEKAQLKDWVYLGTVYSGGEIPLELTLEVPITMGNEYQNSVGYIDWEFKIEELPVDPDDPKPPKTGDTGDIFLYSGLTLLSVAALAVLLYVGKRKTNNEK